MDNYKMGVLTIGLTMVLAQPVLASSHNNPPGSQNNNANSNSNSNSAQGGQGGNGGNGGQGGNGQGGNGGNGQGGNGGNSSANGSANSNNSVNMSTTINSTDSPNFLSLPGVMGAPAVLAIPPENHGNIMVPIALPKRMTYEQAQACRKAWLDDEYEGGRSENETRIVSIDYADPYKAAALDMDLYLGTVSVNAPTGYTFLPALCEAAFRAIEEGATSILVHYTVEKANVTKGIGFGSSAGGSAIPSASSPSALSGVAGFGTGYSIVTNEPRLLSLIAVATHDHNAHFHGEVRTASVDRLEETSRVTVHTVPMGFEAK